MKEEFIYDLRKSYTYISLYIYRGGWNGWRLSFLQLPQFIQLFNPGISI